MYFTSTVSASVTDLPWYINFSSGYTNIWQNYDKCIWPVRGGQVGAPVNYYCDKDKDGYISSSADGTCSGIGRIPLGCRTEPGNDCDDNDPLVNSGEEEGLWGDSTCSDEKDNDCNGFTDNADPECQKVIADLVVINFTGPAIGGQGSTVSVSDTIKNNGPGSVPASTTNLYWSTNSTLDAGDILLGSRSVPSLTAGATSSGSIPVAIPLGTAAGTYYIIAKADGSGAIAETNEANNTRSILIRIGPDLTVTSIITNPVTPLAGRNVTVTVTVKNQGGGAAGAFRVDIYKDQATTPPAGLAGDAYCSIAGLAAGATTTCVQTISYVASGSYKMWAQVDTDQQVLETSETNNTNYKSITVLTPMPDLIVSALTAPSTGGAGQAINVSDTTKNQGSGDTGASTTTFYLSTNFTYEAGDTYLGQRVVSPLASGASDGPAITPLTIPSGTPGGSYYIIAKADGNGVIPETSETNNTKSKSIKIGPDLIVSLITAPASAARGTTISITDTTKNQGGGDAVASTTKLYLSTNTTWDTGDISLGQRSVPGLTAGTSNAGSNSVTIPTGIAIGTYYIIAVSDDGKVVTETNETNNSKTKSITIN
jgi:subtilase family serine protease